jgi:hypothetical protein
VFERTSIAVQHAEGLITHHSSPDLALLAVAKGPQDQNYFFGLAPVGPPDLRHSV